MPEKAISGNKNWIILSNTKHQVTLNSESIIKINIKVLEPVSFISLFN